MRTPSRVPLAIGLVAGAVWLASAVIALSSDFYLSCTDGSGNHMGGMDCLSQSDTVYAFESDPARSIGFDALWYPWLGATLVLISCGIVGLYKRRRRSVQVLQARRSGENQG